MTPLSRWQFRKIAVRTQSNKQHVEERGRDALTSLRTLNNHCTISVQSLWMFTAFALQSLCTLTEHLWRFRGPYCAALVPSLDLQVTTFVLCMLKVRTISWHSVQSQRIKIYQHFHCVATVIDVIVFRLHCDTLTYCIFLECRPSVTGV